MIADTAKRHSKRIARYTTMPPITSSSAIAPSEASSLPTCGPTNSTRRSSGLPPSRALRLAMTLSLTLPVSMPSRLGRRISTSRELPKFCTWASW